MSKAVQYSAEVIAYIAEGVAEGLTLKEAIEDAEDRGLIPRMGDATSEWQRHRDLGSAVANYERDIKEIGKTTESPVEIVIDKIGDLLKGDTKGVGSDVVRRKQAEQRRAELEMAEWDRQAAKIQSELRQFNEGLRQRAGKGQGGSASNTQARDLEAQIDEKTALIDRARRSRNRDELIGAISLGGALLTAVAGGVIGTGLTGGFGFGSGESGDTGGGTQPPVQPPVQPPQPPVQPPVQPPAPPVKPPIKPDDPPVPPIQPPVPPIQPPVAPIPTPAPQPQPQPIIPDQRGSSVLPQAVTLANPFRSRKLKTQKPKISKRR